MYSTNDDLLGNPSDEAGNEIGFFSHQSSNANLSPDQLYEVPAVNFTNTNNNLYSPITANWEENLKNEKSVGNSENEKAPNQCKYQPEEEIVDTSMKPVEISSVTLQPVVGSNEEYINFLISKVQTEVKELYYNHQYDEIIHFLNKEFPNFLQMNLEILYTLMKMKFFFLLLVRGDVMQAESYYFEYFRRIGRDTRRNWERKEQTFLRLLKNPSILKNKNVFEKNVEDFMLDLNRALYKYLYGMGMNEDGHGDFEIKERSNSMETVEVVDSKFNNLNLGVNQNNNVGNNSLRAVGAIRSSMIEDEEENSNAHRANDNNEVCNAQNQEELKDLSQFSTKEEFSDFEEEIDNYQACHNEVDDNLINFFPQPSPLTNINQNFLQFIESQNKNPSPNSTNQSTSEHINSNNSNNSNVQANNIQGKFQQDKNSNFHIYHKQFIPKTQKNEESLHKKLPLLKSFKPKYTKRENVDKKILRRFKLFLKDKYKDKSINLDHPLVDKHFWVMFINGNLLPPMKFIDKNTSENIEFKSFNSKFLLWLFNKKGAKEFYEQFTKEEGNSVLSGISADYNVHDSNDLNQLVNYINNLSFIFDLSNVEENGESNAMSVSNVTSSVANSAQQQKVVNNQAPMPTIDVEFPSSKQKKKMKKLKECKEKESESDDDCLRLNRRLERSRELDFLNFDTLNDFGHFYTDSSDGEE